MPSLSTNAPQSAFDCSRVLSFFLGLFMASSNEPFFGRFGFLTLFVAAEDGIDAGAGADVVDVVVDVVDAVGVVEAVSCCVVCVVVTSGFYRNRLYLVGSARSALHLLVDLSHGVLVDLDLFFRHGLLVFRINPSLQFSGFIVGV